MKTKISQLFLLLSAIGFVDALFLTQKHFSGSLENCPIFGGCETVLNSPYSEIFGIPVSAFGMAYYALIFSLSLYVYLFNKHNLLLIISFLSIAGLITSVLLVSVMIFVIKEICFYCLVSAASSTLIFFVSIFYVKLLRKSDS